MQILQATPARMYKVDKSANLLGTGYLRLVPRAFWYTQRPGYLFTPGFQACILFVDLHHDRYVRAYGGWGGVEVSF